MTILLITVVVSGVFVTWVEVFVAVIVSFDGALCFELFVEDSVCFVIGVVVLGLLGVVFCESVDRLVTKAVGDGFRILCVVI